MGCQPCIQLGSAMQPNNKLEVVLDKEEDEEMDGVLDMEDMDMDMQVLVWVPEPSDPASSSGSLMQQ